MRKNIILLVLFSIFTNLAPAKCTTSGIRVWPSTKTICKNPIFVIEGYSSSQAVISEINKHFKIYLKSQNSTIDLQVLKLYTSQFNLTQAILKPVRNLVSGETYSLQTDSLDHYNRYDFDVKNFRWTASDKTDNEMPRWQSAPFYLDNTGNKFGCGTERFANFCVCINDVSPVIVLARLKALKTGEISQYYVIPDSSFLKIGHGMCSGEFNFIDNENYEISFSLMDASGNFDDSLTNAIEFTSPGEKYTPNPKTMKICNCPKVINKRINFTNYILFILTGLIIIGVIIKHKLIPIKKYKPNQYE